MLIKICNVIDDAKNYIAFFNSITSGYGINL